MPEYNNQLVTQIDMQRFFSAGMVDATTGRFISLLKYTNEGQIYNIDHDCITNYYNVKAKAKWGCNTNGN